MTSPDAPEVATPPAPEGEPPSSQASPASEAGAPSPEVPEVPEVPEAPPAEPPAEGAALEEGVVDAAVAAPQAEAVAAPPSHVWPPPVSAGPYRTPPYEAGPYAARAPRPAWAVAGPTLRVFAVLLWSYVVVGQFTASWPLGRPIHPALALAFVALLTLFAWIAALRASHAVAPPASALRFVGRGLGIAAGSVGLFFGAVVAPMVGAVIIPHMKGYDLLVGFALVAVSLGAALLGSHISYSPDLPRPARTHGQRFALVLAWVLGALLTLVAGADLAGSL